MPIEGPRSPSGFCSDQLSNIEARASGFPATPYVPSTRVQGSRQMLRRFDRGIGLSQA